MGAFLLKSPFKLFISRIVITNMQLLLYYYANTIYYTNLETTKKKLNGFQQRFSIFWFVRVIQKEITKNK